MAMSNVTEVGDRADMRSRDNEAMIAWLIGRIERLEAQLEMKVFDRPELPSEKKAREREEYRLRETERMRGYLQAEPSQKSPAWPYSSCFWGRPL